MAYATASKPSTLDYSEEDAVRQQNTTTKFKPDANKARPVVPSIAPPANTLAANPATGAEMRGARASLEGALPRSVLQQRAQTDARAAVQATQPQVGIDTTQPMEARNQAFRDVGMGAASFDQGPSGVGPVRGIVANTPVATGPVAAGFAGTGVGSPASATGARISGGPSAVMTNPFTPQMTPEQARQEMVTDQLQGKRVAVDPRYVKGIQEQNKAQDQRIANRVAGVGQEGIIGRMNANYTSDRIAREQAGRVRGQEERFARASLQAAMNDPNPAVRAAALQAAGQSNERYAKAAAPVGGFAGARDQLAAEQLKRDQLASAERVAKDAANAKLLASIGPATIAADSRREVAGWKQAELEQMGFSKDQAAQLQVYEMDYRGALKAAERLTDPDAQKAAMDAAREDYRKKALGILSQVRPSVSNPASAPVAPPKPSAPITSLTREGAQRIVDEIRVAHPDWTDEQIKAEARKRTSGK